MSFEGKDYGVPGQSRSQPHTCWNDQVTKSGRKQKEMSREGKRAGEQGYADTKDHEGRQREVELERDRDRDRVREQERDREREKGFEDARF